MIAIIILAALLMFTCACITLSDEFAESEFIRIIALLCATAILALSIVEISKPRAKDVYKGETMLQITYDNNGTPVDTTVVFKDPARRSKL